MTPADAYFGRAETILKQRERIKKQTVEHRRLQHPQDRRLKINPQTRPILRTITPPEVPNVLTTDKRENVSMY